MKNIIVSTETTSDLTQDILTERNIPSINMHYFLDGKEFDGSENFDSHAFYDAMRAGADTKTTMVNEYDATEFFTELLKQGKDIVHISFASACSGTVGAVTRAAEELNKTNKNKIYVVDSLAESGGMGLLVTLVDDYANEGKSAAAVRDYCEELKHRICHYFCVDSLKYLARGGRVSKVTGFIGTAIGIKPFMHTDVTGKLVALEKSVSRRKTLTWLVDAMERKFNGISNRVYICSADCDKDAEYVAGLVKEKFNIEPVTMPLGPVIGSHSGPGTVALFFTAQDRSI